MRERVTAKPGQVLQPVGQHHQEKAELVIPAFHLGPQVEPASVDHRFSGPTAPIVNGDAELDSFCSVEAEEEARNKIKDTLRANIEEVDRHLGLNRDERDRMNRRQAMVEQGERVRIDEDEGSDYEVERLPVFQYFFS